jgi:hypothetical protein
MDYLLDNWGSFVGLVSLIITIIGFAVAIRRATQARKAAEEAREAIVRVLTVADLQRAIALIQRLKVLIRESRWEASLEHYQNLRSMLADIAARQPNPTPESRSTIQAAIPQITVIEINIDRAIRNGTDPSGLRNFNRVLSSIQANLEEIASSTPFADSEESR